jgi:2-polyprenyl-6-methoxyphenol hydroxylase-like FAD-dependent oxidoreductase
MRTTDIAIIGGGLAGSTAAAMLGRAGFGVVLVDPHAVYPPELRCEKIDGPQARILQRTGIADAVLRAGTFDGASWVARFGRLVEKRPGDQYGILYDTLVNAVRAQIPAGTEFINAKATAVALSADRQTVTLSNDEILTARLVVLANGLNIGLRHTLGMTRETVSPCHSITIAFDLKPVNRRSFPFPALTYYAERTADRLAYITLFPIGATMRANFMVYRTMDDPWLSDMRHRPTETLHAIMPGLQRLAGDYEVVGPVKIRPADLVVTKGFLQAGIVLVGDAFSTSCPAAGTGTNKVFTDVERLCNVHIPHWLATKGMGVEKIAAFYDDPFKRICDAQSTAKAYHLRSLSIDDGWSWRLRRWGRFLARLGMGAMWPARERLAERALARQAAADNRAQA